MVKRPGEPVDPGMVWWLIDMGQRDRAMYRKLRALAWELVQANKNHSVNPNEAS